MRDWLPVILWMAAIFWGSSCSTLPGPWGAQSVWAAWLGDVTHIAEYAILAGLLYRALSHGALRTRDAAPEGHRRAMWTALALALAYAVLDEVHQFFVPGREFALADLWLDAGGSALALAALRTLFP